MLSISRFSRLTITSAWLFALNKKHQRRRGLTVTFGPRPLRMSWLTCCCCIAVIACGIGLFHMARASNRLTSVQINTTKQFWFVRSCSVFTAPPDAHICLKCAYVLTPSVGSSGSLSTVNVTCNNTKDTVQKHVGAHLTSPRTIKSGVHLFASLEKTTCRHCSSLRSLMNKRPSQISPFFHGCCSIHELRGTF